MNAIYWKLCIILTRTVSNRLRCEWENAAWRLLCVCKHHQANVKLIIFWQRLNFRHMQHFWIILKIQSAFILFSQTSSVNAIPHSLLFISSLLVSLDVWIKRQRGVKAIREKEIKSGFDNKAYPSNEADDYEKKQTVTKKKMRTARRYSHRAHKWNWNSDDKTMLKWKFIEWKAMETCIACVMSFD